MKEQPEALRLADELEDEHYPWPRFPAAAELRRLHEELERCKQVCAVTAEAWREESERTADAHLKQGLTIAELFEQRDALLEMLKLARSIIGHPDDAHSQMIDAAIKAVEEGK